MRSRRAILGFALACTLVAACGATTATQAPATGAVLEPSMAAVAEVTAAPTPVEITAPPASPSPTPVPITDGQGDEVVKGVMILNGLTTNYKVTKVGDVNQYRGGVLSLDDTTNDPRTDGSVTIEFSLDEYTVAGSEWMDMTIKNANGAWEGTCTGGAWATGDGIAWSCWLTGSGDYDGYTYYKQILMEPGDSVARTIGVVYPGDIPTGEVPTP